MKEITLTQGQIAIVDDEDFEFLNQFKWYAHKSNKTFYAGRNITMQSQSKRKTIFMHREIMKNKLKENHINIRIFRIQITSS